MVVSDSHQLKRFDVVGDEDEDADEEVDEDPPPSVITTYTEAIKLGITCWPSFKVEEKRSWSTACSRSIRCATSKLKYLQHTSLLDVLLCKPLILLNLCYL